jgi:hypothetical protein
MISKPARPSLADMLPAKGLATRPEPLPPIENEAPAAGGEIPQVEQARSVDGKATALPPAPAAAPASRAEVRTKPARVVRIPLTVKVSESVYQRLREASFREETDKQDLVDQALDALLAKMGY